MTIDLVALHCLESGDSLTVKGIDVLELEQYISDHCSNSSRDSVYAATNINQLLLDTSGDFVMAATWVEFDDTEGDAAQCRVRIDEVAWPVWMSIANIVSIYDKQPQPKLLNVGGF